MSISLIFSSATLYDHAILAGKGLKESKKETIK